MTKGYALPARWVIHAVGPVWEGGSKGEAELLASCYRSIVGIAVKYQASHIKYQTELTKIVTLTRLNARCTVTGAHRLPVRS